MTLPLLSCILHQLHLDIGHVMRSGYVFFVILLHESIVALPQGSTEELLPSYSGVPEQPEQPDYSDTSRPIPEESEKSTQMQMVDVSSATLDPETGKFCFMQRVCLANVETLVQSFPDLCSDDDDEDDDDEEEEDGSGDDDFVVPDLGIVCDCSEDSDCVGLEFGRCVSNCVCRSCPTSVDQSRAFNPPLTFVVDTTKSVRPDRASIFNLTQEVVARVQAIGANIPAFQLVTFNDLGDENPEANFEVLEATSDIALFGNQILDLTFDSFDGGRDSRERLMQGLLAASENTAEGSLVVVFTDNGSKNLELEQNILELKALRNITVYIVLTPVFEGFPQDPSLGVYDRVADELFFVEQVGPETLIGSVELFEQTNCI